MSSIAMAPQPGADLVASYPLVAQLFTRHGYAELSASNLDAFLAQPGRALLAFLEDPLRIKETLDLAVILPQLERAFPARFRVGVLLPEAARQQQLRYGFNRWPALVMLADGQYVGAVDGLRNWDDYLAQIEALLASGPSRPPTVGIAVRGAGDAPSACAG